MTYEAENITSGVVLGTKGTKFGELPTLGVGKHNSVLKSKGPSNGGKCAYRGNARHTSDTYFKLHGYPEWRHELQAKKKRTPLHLSTTLVKLLKSLPSLTSRLFL